MRLKKRLNNNAVIALDSTNQECVLFGNGIAFNIKEDEDINEELIERVFFQREKNLFQQLVEEIPQKYFDLTCEIIEYIEKNLNIKLSNSIYITLMDHISFIKERAEKGMLPRNSMKWEIVRYYNNEYKISKKIVEFLEDEFEIDLNDDEAASIALHIVNAENNTNSVDESIDMIHLVDDILNIICYQTGKKLDYDDLNYQRLVTHIKFFVQRLYMKQRVDIENPIYNIVVKEYPKAYEIAEKVRTFAEKKLNYKIYDEEITYLTVHIQVILKL